MPYSVRFTPEADNHLTALYAYIAAEATPVTAERYVTAIIDYCESLATFPERAPARDDIRPGLRVTHYKGRAIVPYFVDEPANVVWILGIYYGGQDFEAALAVG
ncbi:MAG TPA: type II toxin-antitoxin system RelE/ParE family toxin [Burkholderiaceae bacterium]|nr:type II toxin-antitoxin system RelE/ParE family toxin [Burkholderiaceae bacterium]